MPTDDDRSSLPIAIIGAGLTGLTAGRVLSEAGHVVRLFDKGRGPGGRMASRRDPFVFDHGAQYLTVRDARFQRRVDEWVGDGLAAEWSFQLGVASDGSIEAKEPSVARYVGVPRMSAITRALAADLDVQTRTRVETLERDGNLWHLEAEDGADLGRYGTVLVTLPPVQSVALLKNAAPDLAANAQAVEMRPCWAVLAAFDGPIATDFDALFVHDAPLSWVARNSSKPGRPDAECWVLHGSPAWSASNLERDPDAVRADLLAAFFDTLAVDPIDTVYATAHRWRYALAAEPIDVGCFYDSDLWLGLGGDWCHGSRVEGAFLSGAALADRVLAETRGSSGLA